MSQDDEQLLLDFVNTPRLSPTEWLIIRSYPGGLRSFISGSDAGATRTTKWRSLTLPQRGRPTPKLEHSQSDYNQRHCQCPRVEQTPDFWNLWPHSSSGGEYLASSNAGTALKAEGQNYGLRIVSVDA